MKRSVKSGVLIACATLALYGCGGSEPEQSRPAIKPPVKPQAPEPAPIDRSAELEQTVDARARNPFQSHIMVMKGARRSEGEAAKARSPLECCELSAFRLLAVVSSRESGFGLIQAPDGKRYIVRRGDVLGTRDGKVTRIGERSVTVRETGRDEAGNPVPEDTELRLPAEKRP